MQTKFLLGEIRITKDVSIKLKRVPFDLICRHAINEHGNINKNEARNNALGMETLGAIISRYKSDPTDPHSPNVVIYTRETWDETVVYLD